MSPGPPASSESADTLWHRHTSADHGAALDRLTMVVPIGSTEQHGPHLPVGVDALVCEHVARAAVSRVHSAERPVLVAPTLAYGSSHHHLPRPGTLSLSSDTMLHVLRDIMRSAAVTGVRRMLIVNGHGGNEDVARQAARDVALEFPVVAAAMNYWSVAWDRLLETANANGIDRVPGHAGAFETSLVLAIAPEAVDNASTPSVNGNADGAHDDAPLADLPNGVTVERHGWVHAIDGYSDSAAASADVGALLVEAAVDGLAGFLAEFIEVPAPQGAAQ